MYAYIHSSGWRTLRERVDDKMRVRGKVCRRKREREREGEREVQEKKERRGGKIE